MDPLLFDEPRWLQSLWLLLPLAWLLIRGERRRRAAATRFAAPLLAAQLLPPLGGARPWWRIACTLLGLAALAVAAAGPRLGLRVEPTQQRGADLLVLLDVSRSMLSEDVAPNRLERARSDVRDLVDRLEGHRVGLVLFAGKATLACPLTFDKAFFRAALAEAGPGSAPLGGTAIGDALRTALEALPAAGEREQALLLITDGEDHESMPLEAARAAAERGVRLFTVGLGDPQEGARVPTPDAAGAAAYLKHEGQEVWSKMQEGLLSELATLTGGAYVPARTRHFDLGALYVDHLAKLRRGDLGLTRRQRHTPRFAWLIGAALLFLAAARVLAPRRLAPAATRRFEPLRAAGLLAALLLAAPPAGAASDAPSAVAEGIARLAKGDSAAAIERFDAAAALAPQELAIVFDRGCAKQQAGDREGATADFTRAATARDPALAAKARFNLGTLAVARAQEKLGADPEEAEGEARTESLAAIDEAVGRFRSALAVAPDHAAARKNLEQLKVWRKHIEERWAARDRERRREQLDVAQFLDWLREEEGRWRDAVRPLATVADSPLRRTAVEALVRQQRELLGELPTVKEKLAKLVEQAAEQAAPPAAPPGSDPGSDPAPPPAPPDPAQFEAALRTFVAAVDAIGASLRRGEEALAARDFGQGDAAGFAAQQGIDALWAQLVGLAPLIVRGDEVAARAATAIVPFTGEGAAPLADDTDALRSLREAPERLALFVPLLAPHAEAATADEALRPAAARTLEVAPALAAAVAQAQEALRTPDAAAARPPLEEAARLLKELRELLPKQEPEDDPQQSQDQQQQQDPQDQQQKEQQQDQKQDEGDGDKKDRDKKDSDKKDDGKKDGEKNNGEKQEQEQKPADGKESGESGERSAEEKQAQAQTLIRRALERAEQKRDEAKKVEEVLLRGRGRVERDW
ncbi:MAG: VWA domain-containing protein [Planctomycetes bacterium]|nr:VWA domain-containing protein [Planctomycetota bacterium]